MKVSMEMAYGAYGAWAMVHPSVWPVQLGQQLVQSLHIFLDRFSLVSRTQARAKPKLHETNSIDFSCSLVLRALWYHSFLPPGP